MMKKYVFISFITLYLTVSAKINIKITTSIYLNKTEVSFTGTDVKLVTDAEVTLFNITHENLNKGIRIEMGRIPDDIYLRDPTPYEDLFKSFDWPQVARVLAIKNAKIVEFIQEDVVIKTHEHINNTTMCILSKTDMMEMVENTIISQWSDYGLPKDEITNEVNIDFGYEKWNFDAKWRDEKLKSIKLPFAATKGTVNMTSGQTIVSKLLGTKIILIIEIDYVAKLVGNIIGNYERLFGKYHFWSPALQSIMRAAKLKNEIFTREYLELRFYTNPKLNVFDRDNGRELNVELKKRHWRKKGNYNFSKIN